MALRQFGEGKKSNQVPAGLDPARLPRYAATLGAVGAAVGLVTLFWIPFAEPQFGGFADRYVSSSTKEKDAFSNSFGLVRLDNILYQVGRDFLVASAFRLPSFLRMLELMICLCNACFRWDFFKEAFSLNRAFFAFVLDAGLYSIFQAVLLGNAPPVYRFTPFFGLAAWLIVPIAEEES